MYLKKVFLIFMPQSTRNLLHDFNASHFLTYEDYKTSFGNYTQNLSNHLYIILVYCKSLTNLINKYIFGCVRRFTEDCLRNLTRENLVIDMSSTANNIKISVYFVGHTQFFEFLFTSVSIICLFIPLWEPILILDTLL
jgi:hypothetical protein